MNKNMLINKYDKRILIYKYNNLIKIKNNIYVYIPQIWVKELQIGIWLRVKECSITIYSFSTKLATCPISLIPLFRYLVPAWNLLLLAIKIIEISLVRY